MTIYADDREGCMRIHIAEGRALDAARTYTKPAMVAHAKANGVVLRGKWTKTQLAVTMAFHGLIADGGALRNGWPS